MSGFLPAGTLLQLSDSSGNIAHQGVLGSNINGSTLLSSFPTSSTGSSLGHYHYTESGTNALKFLNVSGSGTGGHKFYTANSTTAPVNTCSVGLDGLTIDRTDIVGSTQVLNLQDGLTINTGSNTTTLNTTFLKGTNNKTSLEFNTPDNGLYVYNTSGNIRSSSKSETIEIQDFANNLRAGMTVERFFVFNQNLNTNTNLYPGLLQQGDLTNVSNLSITELQINDRAGVDTSTLNRSSLNITNSTNSNTSILTANDLTFNSVSLPSKVSQNTLDISQNRTDISRNTLNIAQNTLDISQNRTDISKNKIDISLNTNNINTLTIKQTNTIYQFSSPAIYADGQPPSATPTSIINSYAINAWYFKNLIAGQKINWYMPTTSGLKVQDILGLYLRLFNVSTTSSDNSLFLTVYTTPDAGPNYSWYKSRMVYVITATPTINTLYTFFANASGSCPSPSNYASTTLQMTPSTVSNPRGTYGPTENIMFFSIGSNSASAVNSVEVVVQKFGVMTPTGTQEFQFAPLL